MAKALESVSFTRKGELLGQATIDLRDARCIELSANRRFECAYDAALRTAASMLGENYLQTHGDLAAFCALEDLFQADFGEEVEFMVHLRRTEDRRCYEGLTSITPTDVARAISWVERVREGAIQHVKNHIND